MLDSISQLLHAYDPETGQLDGGTLTERRLLQLEGAFADRAAFEAAVAKEDPIVYRVSSLEPGDGPGDLHLGLGTLYPGRVGEEFFLTKGHLHAAREAAEVYLGVAGEGFMLLESEDRKHFRCEPLGAGKIVYVPGHTAHRTVNTGNVPLVYFGIYPARAGHDYGTFAEKNFSRLLVARPGGPQLVDRATYQPPAST